MSGVRGYENLYNESVNDIALHNYNKGIAQRLRMQQDRMQQNLPFKEPKMLSGGVRASTGILAGTAVAEPSTLAVGGRAFRTFTGKETPSMGGKINRLKKAQKWTGFSKGVVDDAFDIAERAVGGKINRLKKAQKWTDFSKGVVNDAFDIAERAGGKISRSKKAQKWTDFSKGVVNDAFDIVERAGGKINRLKKAQKWTDFSKGVVNDAFDIAERAGGGMVYSPALKKALGGCGSCKGGAIKPRTGRMVKGSPEALAFGARMKALREAKKGN